MTRRFAIILLQAVCAGLGLAHHQQPSKEAGSGDREGRAADRAAIRKTFQQFLKTLAKGDADAVASFWTNSGEYVDEEGDVIRGRKALAAARPATAAIG